MLDRGVGFTVAKSSLISNASTYVDENLNAWPDVSCGCRDALCVRKSPGLAMTRPEG